MDEDKSESFLYRLYNFAEPAEIEDARNGKADGETHPYAQRSQTENDAKQITGGQGDDNVGDKGIS
jgi:hypothetical protein